MYFQYQNMYFVPYEEFILNNIKYYKGRLYEIIRNEERDEIHKVGMMTINEHELKPIPRPFKSGMVWVLD